MKVAIIGAGPRGLQIAERLLRNHEGSQPLEIDLYDAKGIGGRIWRQDQSWELLMNSISCQVTLFSDASLSTGGRPKTGPNLYEWSQTRASAFFARYAAPLKRRLTAIAEQLGPDDCCPRIYYGEYQRWFFQQLCKMQTATATLAFHQVEVLDLIFSADSWLIKTGKKQRAAEQVVLALGHVPLQLSKTERKLAAYAQRHQLFYQPPSNPADVAADEIPPGEKVALRGLGLSFFDYIGRFFLERGGFFSQEDGQLLYHASGKEPHLVVGSRRGLPHHTRGRNEKRLGEAVAPSFLTAEKLGLWRKMPGNGPRFLQEIKQEVELVYYQTLLKTRQASESLVADFKQQFIKAPKDPEVLAAFAIKTPFDWQLLHPEAFRHAAHESYEAFILAYLQQDIAEAEKGTCSGPLIAALDALKDLRDQVRYLTDHDLLVPEEYLRDLWQTFTRMNRFLSLGPPLIRMRQLLALFKAGYITFIPGRMTIEPAAGHFIIGNEARSASQQVDYLIEARLPQNDLTHTASPLLQNLRQKGILQEFSLSIEGRKTRLKAVLVDRKTHLATGKNGADHANLYCFGIPLEGLDWLTATSSRPATDPWVIRQADQIALDILKKL